MPLNHLETIMTTTQLTATQTTILNNAADHPDGNIEPLPVTLRGGARTKVIDGLLVRNLVAHDGNAYLITDTGYAAIGRTSSAPETTTDAELEVLIAAREAEWQGAPRHPRAQSKQATVITLLKQPDGATLRQLMETTGWQAHTVRGTISGMVKKRLGYNVLSERRPDGERVYRIA